MLEMQRSDLDQDAQIDRITKNTNLSRGQCLVLLNGFQANLSINEAREVLKHYDGEYGTRPLEVIDRWRAQLVYIRSWTTVQEVSEFTGIKRSRLYRILNKGLEPRLEEIERLAQAGYIQ